MKKNLTYVETERSTDKDKKPPYVETRCTLVKHRDDARIGSGMSGDSLGNMSCVLTANGQEGVPNKLADMHERS